MGKSLGSLILRSVKRQSRQKRSRFNQKTRAQIRDKKQLRSANARFPFFSSSDPLIDRQKKEEPSALVPAPVSVPVLQTSSSIGSLTTRDLIRPDPSVQRALEGFFLDQRSEHTRMAYSKDLKRFVKYLLVRENDRGLERLDPLVVIGYKDWLLSEQLEHTSIDRHLSTLRSLFDWFVSEGILQSNPSHAVRFLKPRRLSTTLGFSDAEVRRVLAMPAVHTRTGAQHHAILMLLFHCGLRRSELCALRTTNLGVERGRPVMKLRGKGNRERIIPLVTAVWESVDRALRIQGKTLDTDRPLFSPTKNNRTHTLDKHLDPSAIFYLVRKYSQLAGVQNRVSPHSCRATAISNARDRQASDRSIQEFAGWSSPDMITRYDKRKTAIEDSAALVIDYSKNLLQNEPEPS